MDSNENTRLGGSRLRQPTKIPLSPSRSLMEMSSSDSNARSQMPPPQPHFQGTKHKLPGMIEPPAKRETLIDRAGRPAQASHIAPPGSRGLNDSLRSDGNIYRPPPASHSRSVSAASSRIASSSSSFSSSVGYGSRPPSSVRSGRPQSHTSHGRSQSHTSHNNFRPGTSASNHNTQNGAFAVPASKGTYPISLSFNPPVLQPKQRAVSDNREYIYYRNPRQTHFPSQPLTTQALLQSQSCIFDQSSDVSLRSAFQGLKVDPFSYNSIQEEELSEHEAHNNEATPSKIPRLRSSMNNSLSGRSPSPRKTPTLRKCRSASPLKPVFLTKDSNKPVPAFEPDLEMDSTWSKQFEHIKDTINKHNAGEEDRKEVIRLYKTRIAELETLSKELSTTNTKLTENLHELKGELLNANHELSGAKRSHSFDMDDLRRRTEREVEGLNERFQRELRLEKERTDKAAERVTKEFEEQLEEMDKAHKDQLHDQEREIKAELEEEKNKRSREIQELAAQNTLRLQETSQDLERKVREADDVRRERDETAASLQREKALRINLEDKLAEASANNLTLETANRAMKAKIDFLESDNQAQSNSFADLHRLKQEAEEAMNVALEKLRTEETLRRKLHNQVQELKGNIRVMCRVRPTSETEADDSANIAFPDSELDCKEVTVQGPEKTSALGNVTTTNNAFAFDRVFAPASHNAEIFEEISQLVQSALDGYNVCIFCYGQTGSGKTFTMSSADGMIPRATAQIYSEAQRLAEKGWTYKMEGSFVEVYNENLNDLLGKAEELDKKKLEIRHDLQKKTTTITDITTVELDSANRVEEILQRAAANRTVAATKANSRSSRSHSVFILKLIGKNSVTGERSEGTLNLVDLAGSERLAHSQAAGDRLKETQNINKSLSCLGDVIGALGQGKEGTHIPYRNSKLTYLLQNSLGGNSKTLMFVMISPLQGHLSETLTSLKFATKVHNTHIGTAKKQSKVKE